MTIRVLAVDRHAIVRAGMRAILAEPETEVIGEAADGLSAARLADELNPDVVVTEVSLPGITGVELTARLCAERPARKVIALTACEDGESLRRMTAAGAVGYVLNRSSAEELVRAVRAAAEGSIYLDPAVAVHAAEPSTIPPQELNSADLSERECEVVRMIAQGYSNKEIAVRLKVSVKTVETYKTRAREKLHSRSRVDLVRYAVSRGWLLNLDGVVPVVRVAGG